MEEIRREADSSSSRQETPCLLWKPMIHKLADKMTPADIILSQFNLTHTLFTSYNFKIHFNISASVTRILQSGVLPSRFLT